MNILTVNLVLSTFVFWVAARIYVVPNLARWSPQAVLVPILLLHSFRHLGLMFLSPGGIYPGMPPQFANPAAYGDLLAAALAMAAILAGTPSWLVWVFNVVGTVDLFTAITLATAYGASEFMGPAYWIPAFWVPALLVTHLLGFIVLLRHPKSPALSAG
ncbi:MAG TPA: hypothetical protein VFX94_04565 [Burkholderiales bacterium]|jgi:hypothetical protein|nr:hypothetical protein [Burkholderiales bacterium]